MIRIAAWHALAALLVLVFAHTFELWRWLVATLGPSGAAAIPIGLALALAGGFAAILVKRGAVDWRLLALAAALAGIGLLTTDPQFPAKRIHVPQYALLAALLRLTLPDCAGWTRTLGAAFLATLYGVHDEFVQGLMPTRGYGTADMLTNALGAFSGAVALHDPRERAHKPPAPGDLARLAAMATIVGSLAIAFVDWRGAALPWWPSAGFALVFALGVAPGAWRPILRPCALLGAAFPAYILLHHALALPFR
jgi:hypothetical protein